MRDFQVVVHYCSSFGKAAVEKKVQQLESLIETVYPNHISIQISNVYSQLHTLPFTIS